eukprot:365355-Chlamydomonas_euryale.AAC.1
MLGSTAPPPGNTSARRHARPPVGSGGGCAAAAAAVARPSLCPSHTACMLSCQLRSGSCDAAPLLPPPPNPAAGMVGCALEGRKP